MLIDHLIVSRVIGARYVVSRSDERELMVVL